MNVTLSQWLTGVSVHEWEGNGSLRRNNERTVRHDSDPGNKENAGTVGQISDVADPFEFHSGSGVRQRL